MTTAIVVMLVGLAAILIPAIVRKRQYRGPKVLRWQNGRWVATYRKLK